MHETMDRARSAQLQDAQRAPRSRVTCRNCGNSGWLREFETPSGALACGDCGHTRFFDVQRDECGCTHRQPEPDPDAFAAAQEIADAARLDGFQDERELRDAERDGTPVREVQAYTDACYARLAVLSALDALPEHLRRIGVAAFDRVWAAVTRPGHEGTVRP